MHVRASMIVGDIYRLEDWQSVTTDQVKISGGMVCLQHTFASYIWTYDQIDTLVVTPMKQTCLNLFDHLLTYTLLPPHMFNTDSFIQWQEPITNTATCLPRYFKFLQLREALP